MCHQLRMCRVGIPQYERLMADGEWVCKGIRHEAAHACHELSKLQQEVDVACYISQDVKIT